MKNKRWLIIIITLLIIVALVLLSYNIYIDNIAGQKSQEAVEKIQNELKNTSSEKIESLKVDDNEYIGIINIPSINLELPVMSDWSYTKLKTSPARYSGTLKTNDLVICAHSYKNLFRNIKKLKPNDSLIFTDMNGNKHFYEVALIEIISPEDIQKMIENEYDLTLFTCTEDNQNRFTVRLNKIKT